MSLASCPDQSGFPAFIAGSECGAGDIPAGGFLKQGAGGAFVQRPDSGAFAENMKAEHGTPPLFMPRGIGAAAALNAAGKRPRHDEFRLRRRHGGTRGMPFPFSRERGDRRPGAKRGPEIRTRPDRRRHPDARARPEDDRERTALRAARTGLVPHSERQCARTAPVPECAAGAAVLPASRAFRMTAGQAPAVNGGAAAAE